MMCCALARRETETEQRQRALTPLFSSDTRAPGRRWDCRPSQPPSNPRSCGPLGQLHQRSRPHRLQAPRRRRPLRQMQPARRGRRSLPSPPCFRPCGSAGGGEAREGWLALPPYLGQLVGGWMEVRDGNGRGEARGGEGLRQWRRRQVGVFGTLPQGAGWCAERDFATTVVLRGRLSRA
jgi:hypothetical protein